MDKWDRKTNFNCDSCMFWVEKQRYIDLGGPEKIELDTKLGRCRRYAPTMKGYPVVYSCDWCGEHKIGSNPVRDGVKREDCRFVCVYCKIIWRIPPFGKKCPKCGAKLHESTQREFDKLQKEVVRDGKKKPVIYIKDQENDGLMHYECEKCGKEFPNAIGFVCRFCGSPLRDIKPKPQHCDKCTAEIGGIEIRACSGCAKVWVKNQNISVGDLFQLETCPECQEKEEKIHSDCLLHYVCENCGTEWSYSHPFGKKCPQCGVGELILQKKPDLGPILNLHRDTVADEKPPTKEGDVPQVMNEWVTHNPLTTSICYDQPSVKALAEEAKKTRFYSETLKKAEEKARIKAEIDLKLHYISETARTEVPIKRAKDNLIIEVGNIKELLEKL